MPTPNASTALTRSYRRCKDARALALCPPEPSDPKTAMCPSAREGAATGLDSGDPRWRRTIDSITIPHRQELALPVLQRLEPELRGPR